MNSIKISENIALLRREKGITQEELAGVLGVTNQSVSKWETGQCYPDIELLPDIARYFEVSIDELFGYESSIKTIKSDTDDELFAEAVKIAEEQHHIYEAILQRKLKIGYSKAKYLLELMVEQGYIRLDETKTYDSYLFVE